VIQEVPDLPFGAAQVPEASKNPKHAMNNEVNKNRIPSAKVEAACAET
jgi:hypothetical protein